MDGCRTFVPGTRGGNLFNHLGVVLRLVVTRTPTGPESPCQSQDPRELSVLLRTWFLDTRRVNISLYTTDLLNIVSLECSGQFHLDQSTSRPES